jgi:hypothetical protein
MPETIHKGTAQKFTMVRRSLWDSRRFRALPDDSCRYLYLYLLTCHHQTQTGSFVLKEAYALADLAMTGADWTASRFREAKDALVTGELILADDATGEILIAKWWEANGPNNQKWYDGARKQCEAISSPRLRQAALDALNASWGANLTARGLPPPAAARTPSPHSSLNERIAAVTDRMRGGLMIGQGAPMDRLSAD